MPAHPFDLVIFDCDGVLVDSEGLSAGVLIALLADHGVAVDFDHFCARFLGRSFPTVAAGIRADFDVALPPDFEATYRARLLEAFTRHLKASPGIEAVLAAMDVPFCLATSSSPPRCLHSLRMTGLLRHFEGRIFTASEVPRGKPHPDLFLHAAARMGAEPSCCLVIEDSLPGIAAARAAGMAVIRYTGGSHLRTRRLRHDADVRVFAEWEAFPRMLARWRSRVA